MQNECMVLAVLYSVLFFYGSLASTFASFCFWEGLQQGISLLLLAIVVSNVL
jgi:hypothetical protein